MVGKRARAPRATTADPCLGGRCRNGTMRGVETFAEIADERRGLADLLTGRSVALDHLVGDGVATLRSRMA